MTSDGVHSQTTRFIQSPTEWHSKGTPILGAGAYDYNFKITYID